MEAETKYQCRKCRETITRPPTELVRQLATLYPKLTRLVVWYDCPNCMTTQTTEISVDESQNMVFD